jgi:FHA domain-containing protein
MTLTLSALSLNDQPLTQPVVAHFDASGGTIGRGDHNTLTLPDPERHISRQHASIQAEGAGWRITNLSAANAVTVAGRTLAQGESAPVRHRDLVRIGGFLLEVSDDAMPGEAVRTITRGRASVSRPAAGAADPFAPAATRDTPPAPLPPLPPLPPATPAAAATPPAAATAPGATGGAEDDPFLALFGPAVASPAPRNGAPPATGGGAPQTASVDPFAVLNEPLPARVGAAPAAATPPPAVGLDPFDDWLRAPPPPAAPARPPGAPSRPAGGGAPAADPFAALGAMPEQSIDALFGAPGTAGSDIDAFLRQPLSPSQAAAAQRPAHSAPPAADAGALPAWPDHVPATQAALELPALRSAPAAIEAPLPPRQPAPPPPVAAAEPAPAPPLAPSARPAPIPTATAAAAATATTPTPAPTPMPAAPTEPLRWSEPVAAPPVVTAATATATAAPPRNASVAGDDDALWRAFCESAGVRIELPQGLNPELMRMIGSLLRASVDGMVQLMAIRAATKHELRADVTMIQSRNNNPLKFSPDAQGALEQLLQPPLRGFMAGPAAVNDAMHDLVGHTIGTMAGMRAALEGVLQRFQPSVLEGKLVGSSVLDTLLPMNRRARLWELYLQHYETIRQEAQEDFHALFGKAFVAAYEQQLDRLHEQQRARQRASAAAPDGPAPAGDTRHAAHRG